MTIYERSTRCLPLLLLLSLVVIAGCRPSSTQSNISRAPVVAPRGHGEPVIARHGHEGSKFSRAELDELVGPIALYPDPLLAQVLPASTYPSQIEDAAGFIRHKGGANLIDRQSWDTSVRSVAHYPPVLYMMADKPDWTVALGQAYLDQPNDVMDAVQRLRAKSRRLGYLRSTRNEEVIVQSDYVRIVPANPRYLYVPRYDPQVVYIRQAPRRNDIGRDVLIFSAGFIIGSWLNRDCDWDRHHVYYHGWQGGGWVGRSRSYVRFDNAYVNNSYQNRPINVNRMVSGRDIGPYRQQLRSHEGSYNAPASITMPSYRNRNVIAGGGGRLTPAQRPGRTSSGGIRTGSGYRATASQPNRIAPGAMMGGSGRQTATAAPRAARTTVGQAGNRVGAGSGRARHVAASNSPSIRNNAGRRATAAYAPKRAARTAVGQAVGNRARAGSGQTRHLAKSNSGSIRNNAGRRAAVSAPKRAARTAVGQAVGNRARAGSGQTRHVAKSNSGSIRANAGRRATASAPKRAVKTAVGQASSGRQGNASAGRSSHAVRVPATPAGRGTGGSHGSSAGGKVRAAKGATSHSQGGGHAPSSGKGGHGSGSKGSPDKSKDHGNRG